MNKQKARLKFKIKLLEKGISQKQIANDLGYTSAFVSMIISGKKRPTKKFNEWIERNLGRVA